MFYVFNKDNICIAMSDFALNEDDLVSRGEYSKELDINLSIGDSFVNNTSIASIKNTERRARNYRNSLRNQLDIYLKPSSTINDELVTEEQKEILIQDSVLLARWPSNEGWPYIPLPILSPFCNKLLNNPVWEF